MPRQGVPANYVLEPREIFTEICLILEEKLKSDPQILTRTERDLFLKLKGEFHIELGLLHKDVP